MFSICCSSRIKSPTKSRGTSFPAETAKRNEDNHSLLHEDSPPPVGLQSSFFGNFKGFTISPGKKAEPEPLRTAPPPPVTSTIPTTIATSSPVKTESPTNPKALTKSSLFNKPIQKYNSFRNNSLANGVATINSICAAPALPPLNPGSNPRPIISSPVLENSTCTAKELISPLRNAPKVPVRAAPETPKPSESTRPLSTPEIVSNTTLNIKISEEPKKPKDNVANSTLNRIASFLKPAEKKPAIQTNTVAKPTHIKASKVLDKDILRNIKISNPIPQTDIEIAITALPVDSEATKAVVMRAQSMRVSKDKPKPNIQTFGSMRQPSGFKRPLSIPSGTRPKSPPPPRPPVEKSENGSIELNQYDDCLNEEAPLAKLSELSPGSGDNIYAVIEESPVSTLSPAKQSSNSESSESMGLLGEIVSEIQNRNFDSIYSTSTLARKKKEAEERMQREKEKSVSSPDSSDTYVNTASLAYPESEYSNMSGNLKSSASSTSSGYILPSAVNVPVKSQEDTKPNEKSNLGISTFKSDTTKPFSSTFNRPQGPLASSYNKTTNRSSVNKVETSPDRTSSKGKMPSSPSNKAVKSPVNRQVTPPNLRTRKPSPTRTASQAPKSNRSVTNSPDLVISCNSNPSSKPPDVLSGSNINKKPTVSTAKPAMPKAPLKINQKPLSSKSFPEKKIEKTVPVNKVNKGSSDVGANTKTNIGIRNASKSSSNVASLQQKFENKNSVPANSKVKT